MFIEVVQGDKGIVWVFLFSVQQETAATIFWHKQLAMAMAMVKQLMKYQLNGYNKIGC